jgi:hypothetical protein
MTANAVSTTVSSKIVQVCSGAQNLPGASVKVILVTLTSSYDAGGSTLDLSSIFPDRVFWAAPMTATAKDATTGFTTIGLVPGTAKTDVKGGFLSTNWKITSALGASEASGDLSDHVCYIVAYGC